MTRRLPEWKSNDASTVTSSDNARAQAQVRARRAEFSRQAAITVVEVVAVDRAALQVALAERRVEGFASVQHAVIVEYQQIPRLQQRLPPPPITLITIWPVLN